MTRRAFASRHALLLAAMSAGSAASAADAPPLPADFLEYLGSWESDDADWLVASAPVLATDPGPAKAAPPQSTPSTAKRGGAEPPAMTEHKP